MKHDKNKKHLQRARRHARVRARVSGTSKRPRLSVFKSNKYIYVQLIDDTTGKTIAAASTKGEKKGSMIEKAKALGKTIASLASTHKLSQVAFDRGGYIYTGRVKAVADGAREGGLKF